MRGGQEGEELVLGAATLNKLLRARIFVPYPQRARVGFAQKCRGVRAACGGRIRCGWVARRGTIGGRVGIRRVVGRWCVVGGRRGRVLRARICRVWKSGSRDERASGTIFCARRI